MTEQRIGAEKARIEQVYDERTRTVPADRYTVFNPGSLFIMQQRERAVVSALQRSGLHALSGMTILDVGCGTGVELRNLVRYGAVPERLYGIDLLSERLAAARELSPNISFTEASAHMLPYDDSRFDLVMQFTVFSSVPDSGLRREMAREMLRVLRPGGIVLWYDLRYRNPRNADVHAVGKGEIRRLFRGCACEFRSVTLVPPLARALAPFSVLACYLLERLPVLRSHWLAIIRKPV